MAKRYTVQVVRTPVERWPTDESGFTYDHSTSEVCDQSYFEGANDAALRKVQNLVAFYADHRHRQPRDLPYPVTTERGFSYSIRFPDGLPRNKKFRAIYRNIFAEGPITPRELLPKI